MDFLIGGAAAVGAGVFSNPFDVVKTRMQLQGELQSRGNYAVHYRNVPHAVYMIAKNDGILALQKGLVPALGFQFVFNSIRLGLYDVADAKMLTKNKHGDTDIFKSIFYGATSGIVGAIISSPFYLVKTQIQSSAHSSISVGFQHQHSGSIDACRSIISKHGWKGLFQGVGSSIPRLGVASAVQLLFFARSKEMLKNNNILVNYPISAAFVASNISGLALIVFMCPFDVIATRMYNQEVDKFGKGLTYRGVFDCGVKILKSEGFTGLYKGVGPFYLRVAPHTVFCLIFWDYFKILHNKFTQKEI